jgi:hypothetical protein
LIATADDNVAIAAANDSSTYQTVSFNNQAQGGPIGLFKVLKAETRAGSCGIGDGDLICTSGLKTLAKVGGGERTVETYAVHSAENWMEDFGTGTLGRGVAVIELDPTFAETIAGDGNYHVFLTPRGDSKGLYVINATPTGFEVRESGGGTSSLEFDYRIVGKRRGYENERLADVTDRVRVEESHSMLKKLAETAPLSPRRDTRPTPHAPAPRPIKPGPNPDIRPGGEVGSAPHQVKQQTKTIAAK